MREPNGHFDSGQQKAHPNGKETLGRSPPGQVVQPMLIRNRNILWIEVSTQITHCRRWHNLPPDDSNERALLTVVVRDPGFWLYL